MMGFFAVIGWIITGISIIASALRKPPRPEPGSVSEMNLPTIAEGTPIPVAYGTCLLRSPMIAWRGDFKSNYDRFYRLGSKVVTRDFPHWDYYVGLAMGLCMGPIDALHKIYWDEHDVNNDPEYPLTLKSSTSDYWEYEIDSPRFWGGKGTSADWGIHGRFVVYGGTDTQTYDPYVNLFYGATPPAWRGISYCVMSGMEYVDEVGEVYTGFRYGQEVDVKPLAFSVCRWPNPLSLSDGMEKITPDAGATYDANPACVIYDIMTNATYGAGIPAGYIDTTSFVNAATTLYNEGLGISIVWSQETEYSEFVADALKHIDGVIQQDETTGQFMLCLIRNDYTLSSMPPWQGSGALPVFDESNILSFSMQRASWEDTRNAVRATYYDRAAKYRERTAQAQDLANIQSRGGVVQYEDVTFPGASNAATAQLLAARTLKLVSYPFATYTIEVNRAGWCLRPGDVIRLQWSEIALDIAARVINVRPGTLTEGAITVDCTEDQFSMQHTIYPGSENNDLGPEGEVGECRMLVMIPAPWGRGSPDTYNAMALVARPDAGARGYDIWCSNTQDGGGVRLIGRSSVFTPMGYLYTDITEVSTSLVVEELVPGITRNLSGLPTTSNAPESIGGSRIAMVVPPDGYGNFTLQQAEFIAVDNATHIEETGVEGRYTVSVAGGTLGRGVHDTAPRKHAHSGAYKPLVVFLALEGRSRPPMVYDGAFRSGYDAGVTAVVQSYNSRGTEDYDDPNIATNTLLMTVAEPSGYNESFESRAVRPWCPCWMYLNYASYPSTFTGNIALGWGHRLKTELTDYTNSNASVLVGTRTDGITYYIRMWRDGVEKTGLITLVPTTGITGQSWLYTTANETADLGAGGVGSVYKFQVWATDGTWDSYTCLECTATRTG